jgi:S1-C subfamily serine protease
MTAAGVSANGPVRAQGFDATVLDAVTRLRAEVPADSRSARNLGTERDGNGIVIDNQGLVLTIGYLILEAMSVTVADSRGAPVTAEVVGYDQATGFGLVRASRPLGIKPLPLGDSDSVKLRTPVLVVGHGGREGTVPAYVVSRREFAGYWEYLLDEAIFTSPPHPNWGGTALVGADGKLYGVGSLMVGDAAQGDKPMPGNMFVPINLLKPIFADLLSEGRVAGPRRPWLGMWSRDTNGHPVIAGVAPESPAERAGLRPGDMVLAIGGRNVASLADMYRKIWGHGVAGSEIPMHIMRDGRAMELAVKSADRTDFVRRKRSY